MLSAHSVEVPRVIASASGPEIRIDPSATSVYAPADALLSSWLHFGAPMAA